MKKLTLREAQLVELSILKEFDRICKKHGLKYSLAGGTMLGAVRHKGFIPWDDDIDVCMPRPDYEKFIGIFGSEADGERYALTHDRGDNAMYPFLKMTDKNVHLQERLLYGVENLWIDIFPVDGLPDSIKKSKKIIDKAAFYRHIIVVNKWRQVKHYNGKHNKVKFYLARVFSKLYGEKRALKNTVKRAMRCDYESANYAGIVVWGCYGIGERIKKSGFENLTEVEFEDGKFSAMSTYDEYLTGIYGDYMTPPPEENRVWHGADAYTD